MTSNPVEINYKKLMNQETYFKEILCTRMFKNLKGHIVRIFFFIFILIFCDPCLQFMHIPF